MIYLLTIAGREMSTGAEIVYRFGTAGYSHPTAPAFFEPRLSQPALFRRDLFERGKTGGASKTGWGEIILLNGDGGLDDMITIAFDDGDLSLVVLESDQLALTAAKVVLTGTIEQVLIGLSDVRVRVRDRQALIDKPVQAVTFGGTNQLPDGVDGVEDIKGRVKPDAWGTILNAEPVRVNTVKEIYQISAEKISAVNDVFDSGAALQRGIERISVAELEAAAPTTGHYDFVLSDQGSFIRLAATPAGRVTVDFAGVVRDGLLPLSGPQIIKDILLSRTVFTADDLNLDDFAAAHAARPWACGLYVSDDSRVPDLLDALAASCGCWWGFDKHGKVRIKPVIPPTGPAEITFRVLDGTASLHTEVDIIAFEINATADQGRGIPVHRVTVGYAKNWSVQDASELVSAADRTVDFAGNEYRQEERVNQNVKNIHPSSGELSVQTLLNSQNDAGILAETILNLYGNRRNIVKISASMTKDLADSIDLCAVVAVKSSRFGWDSGKKFLVTSLRYDLEAGVVEAELWG